MKLRNKKTGEILNYAIIEVINGYVNEREVYEKDDTLAKLNEEWEDYEESEFWYVEAWGKISKINLKNDLIIDPSRVEETKEIGNYFETKEEAKKAVEKLKAWKRLRNKGFRFELWDYDGGNYQERIRTGRILFRMTDDEKLDKDLDLLFGGE